ncbi:CsbD family protein [Paraburkholderia rhizosphaerae]|uniref:Uncharacterized protein YjbJ (UPF0337 family) n=1 Tax=Paraburkholderia rhizosphaerae TaxID=480658 RepID=A0A4R8LLS4_9BURK|nr:CsbD family protein [Paraburkholderia rhizosphaerae]TDY43869.1 uncharacterized protein YjbJ (UPF0337 family) [Paraburkholderia rhizosphaerae]
METTKLEGTLREAAGNVKDTLGDLTGDVGMQVSGKAKALCGSAQQACADAATLARDSVVDRPLTTLAVVATTGFLLGILWKSNRADAANGGGMRRR